MAIICINEDGTQHDFSSNYLDFLEGKIGKYDGSRNASEQFIAYMDFINEKPVTTSIKRD